MVLGTPGYMAPESLFGDTDIDARADLFSVGVLMFEMLAGRLPFRGSDPHKMMIATASKPVPNLQQIRPDISKAMNRLVLTSLAKNPDDRFQSASEVLEYLRAAAVGRIIHHARPCKTRIGVPSIMPAPVSPNQMAPKTVEKPEPQREAPYRREDPSQPKAPSARGSGQPSYEVGDVHSVPPKPAPQKKSLHPVPLKRRRFTIWVSPFYLIVIVSLGVGGYYLYSKDRLSVTTDSVVDPIDERIESLNNQPLRGITEVDEQVSAQRPLRDDGTPVPVSVIIWIETSLKKFEVTKGDRILVERPLVLTGDTKPVELTFSARGYEKKVYEVVPDREQTLKIKLKKKR
jgi:serine/threonine protein kinase